MAGVRVPGRMRLIRLSPTEGVARILCEDADHLTVTATVGTARLPLAARISDLPAGVRTRIRLYVAAGNAETVRDVILRLVRSRVPAFRFAELKTFVSDPAVVAPED